MRICVIGAGAMGATYGGRLAGAGVDVSFVDTWAEHVLAINAHGLRLDGIPGELRLRAPATAPDAAPVDMDVAFICVDANTTKAAAETARRALKRDGFAVTLQNGVGNVEALREALGAGRVVAGSTMCSAIPIGPGHITQTHEGATAIGEPDGGGSARVDALKALLERAGFTVKVAEDVMAVVWNKFVLNVAINPVCAVTGLRLGELARLEATDAFQDHILDEALAVVAAKGVTLPDPDIRATVKRHCWSKFSKPSMLQHIERGRMTEIDALNGAVVREGAALGVPTPYNAALTALVKGRQLAARRAHAASAIDYERLEANAGPWPGDAAK